jgi:hypothetical protein
LVAAQWVLGRCGPGGVVELNFVAAHIKQTQQSMTEAKSREILAANTNGPHAHEASIKRRGVRFKLNTRAGALCAWAANRCSDQDYWPSQR